MFGAQKKIEEAIEQLEAKMQALIDSKVKALENRFAALPFPTIKEELQGIRTQFQKKLVTVEENMAEMRQCFASKEEHDAAVGCIEEVALSARELEAGSEALQKDLNALSKVVENYNASHVEAFEFESGARRKVEGNVEANVTRIDELYAALREASEAASVRHDEMTASVEETRGEFTRLEATVKETMQRIETSRAEFHAEKSAQHQVVTVDLPQRLEELRQVIDDECKVPISVLDSNMSSTQTEVAALRTNHARGVHWVVGNFREKLHHMLTKNSTVWSPNFSVLAQPSGIINLRVHPARGGEKFMTADVQSMPVPGLLNVELWFPVGRTIRCKLTVGKTTRQVEHVFEGSGPRACCPFLNFCNLDQVWDRRKDSISVSLEIIDLRISDTVPEIPIEAPSEATLTVCNLGQVETLTQQVHVQSEAGILDKLNRQLAAIKNRWVRQVEWDIRGINDLLEKTAVGDSMDSPIMSVSGIERMRLVFYPKGVKDGPSGQCGLFLACPQDVRMKFALSVGKQRRVLEHVFTDHQGTAGDLCGKAKFCNLEHQVEDRLHPGREKVTVVLEIIEVELLTSSMNKTGDSTIIRRLDPSAYEELKKVISLPTVDARNVKVALTSPKALARIKDMEDARPHTSSGDRPHAAIGDRPHTSSGDRPLSRERRSVTSIGKAQPLAALDSRLDSRDLGAALGRPQSQPGRERGGNL